ncbi:VanZ family protein [Deinococcus ruber]|uniref:Antibiotic resistance protein VanZ n=1 Tax=Deinococcus ruber TaxID=1848197 RepID=A0A918CL19_9DEIO|nr:VanZ family protein [Deinococcus ruber]GGR28649.1 antibiotic resistance protein VanZ [Deinococcus ruber]
MRAVCLLLGALLMAGLWWLGSSTPPAHPLDWLEHAALYALLTALLRVGFRSSRAALGVALWVAAFDEVHRAFVPGQEPGIQSWLFALLGSLLASQLRSRRRAEDLPETVNLS